MFSFWAVIPKTSLWLWRGCLALVNVGWDYSMDLCFITNPGNSANTESIHEAKEQSYLWTNKQQLCWRPVELENFKERNSSHSLHLHHSFQTLKNLKLPAMLFDPIFCQIWLTKVSSRHFTALQNISWHFMAFLRKASFGSFFIFFALILEDFTTLHGIT